MQKETAACERAMSVQEEATAWPAIRRTDEGMNEESRIPVYSENTGVPTSVEVSGLKGDHEGLILLNTRVDNAMLTKRNALRLAFRLVKYVIKEAVGF